MTDKLDKARQEEIEASDKELIEVIEKAGKEIHQKVIWRCLASAESGPSEVKS